MTALQTFSGGCHCGAVRYEVDAAADFAVYACNCSICSMSGFRHLFVDKACFRLLQGSDMLTSYRFNTRAAEHLFCRRCGVKSFYRPRSHPDGISVNPACLDGVDLSGHEIGQFDGRNWEKNVQALRKAT